MTQQNSTTFRIGSKIVATGLKPDQVSSLLLQVEPWYSSRKCRKSGMGGRDKVLIQFDFLELVIGIFFPLFFFRSILGIFVLSLKSNHSCHEFERTRVLT